MGCSIAQMEDGPNFRALEIQRWANYKFLSVSLIKLSQEVGYILTYVIFHLLRCIELKVWAYFADQYIKTAVLK